MLIILHFVSLVTKSLFSVLVVLASALIIFVLVTINTEENSIASKTSAAIARNQIEDELITFETIVSRNRTFNLSSEDLFVLLHIQKTGGTAFERHLVQDLHHKLPCSCTPEKRRCICLKKIGQKEPKTIADVTWLISRFSTGWVCGLHPDFTQLRKCLASLRQLFFLTFLRHPLHRFVSEFRHVQRGATWKASRSHCKQHNTQLCYKSKSHWSNVSLDEFLSCPHNMAVNRQTRMLASYNNQLLCNDSRVTHNVLLTSAMSNLKSISFFGICEQQRVSQRLFEATFNMQFSNDFAQSEDNKTRIFISELPSSVIERIVELNSLDMKLYNYALDLFAHRCNRLTGSNECGVIT